MEDSVSKHLVRYLYFSKILQVPTLFLFLSTKSRLFTLFRKEEWFIEFLQTCFCRVWTDHGLKESIQFSPLFVFSVGFGGSLLTYRFSFVMY